MEVEEAREVEASPNDGDGASPSEGQGEEEHHIENSPGAPDAAPDTAPDTAPDSSPLLVDEALPSEPSEAPTNGPVYRRKLKKLAAVGAEEVGPSGAGTGLAEEGGKNEGGSGKVVTKGESGKKRKPGFQKKDKGQVEEALVWMEGEFEIGDLVWTRLKGHPWWPSQVGSSGLCNPAPTSDVLTLTIRFFAII